jgi:uncharacterized protein YbaP (TraB family)
MERLMKTHKLRACGIFPVLAALICQAVLAQDIPGASTNRHSLWKLSGEQATVYLLGSIHLFKAEDYPLPAPIERAFTNAAVAVFETDIGELERRALEPETLAKTLLPPGQTFREQLSAQTYNLFTNYAVEAGLPLFMLERLRPVMAAMALVELECMKLGFEPENGIDMHYYKLARGQGKTLVPLESVDFQLNLLTSFSKEETELLVKSTLEDIKTTRKEFAGILKAWKSGDTAGLETLLNSMAVEAPAIFKRLVTDRTERWVPKIQELSRGKTNAIVIVGAAHLVGKDGLVELLRKKDLKVAQE